MAFHFKKYSNSILGLLALFAFVFIPDVIFGLFNSSFETSSIGKNIIIAMLIAFFINFSASKKTIVFIITLCFLMQITQLAYFYYYGVYYSGYDITLLLSNKRDLLSTMTIAPSLLIASLAASVLFYAVALVVYLQLFSKTLKLPYLSVLFVIALLVPFLQALSSDTSQKFQPNSSHLSIKNSLYAISFFAAQEIERVFELSQDNPAEIKASQ